MTRPNPDHLFEQADKLVAQPPAGRPRQVDLRRAISAAYYGVFHFCLAAAADEFVGAVDRAGTPYSLVYRSIASAKYRPYFPPDGFGSNILAFSTASIGLQEKRHLADYSPLPRFKTSDATLAISAARSTVQNLQAANAACRRVFLTLLVCPPR